MAGTSDGGKAAAATNKEKYGEDFYKRIAAIGGRRSRGYAFGHGKVNPSEIGKKGGYVSRRSRPLNVREKARILKENGYEV